MYPPHQGQQRRRRTRSSSSKTNGVGGRTGSRRLRKEESEDSRSSTVVGPSSSNNKGSMGRTMAVVDSTGMGLITACNQASSPGAGGRLSPRARRWARGSRACGER